MRAIHVLLLSGFVLPSCAGHVGDDAIDPPAPRASTSPPRDVERTAAATNGTVTEDAPPIRTGLRPNTAVIGAVRMEVNRPRIGGSPISDAIASP